MDSESKRSDLAPELVSVDVTEASDSDEQVDEQADEQPAEELPVIDEDGVVHLTRTTTKGG